MNKFAPFLALIFGIPLVLVVIFLAARPFLPAKNINPLESDEIVNQIKNSTGRWEDTKDEIGYFQNQPVAVPKKTEVAFERRPVLGVTTAEKWIEIDLGKQRLYAREGDKIAYEFLVSSGKWAPTPTGDFRIWIKLRYTRMAGGDKADNTFYDLPNVPYVMYFYKGFGLHGTYWHNNFGQPMSHGCVNLATPDAEKLYYWTNPVVSDNQTVTYPTTSDPGTRVVIHS